jgi:glycosyl transferase family 2
VRVFRQPNRGPGPARALGTLEATSDYVAYVDADDWFLPDWLRQAREIIESDDVHFLFADLQRGEPGSEESTWGPRNSNNFGWFIVYCLKAKGIPGKHPVHRFNAEDGWELFLRGYPVYPTTVVVRKSSAIVVGNWSGDFRRAEDFDMWLRLSKRYPCHYFDKVVSVLGLHDVNRDRTGYVLLQSQWDVKVLACCLETANAADSKRLKRALTTRFCQLGWQLRQRGEMVEARKAYVSAMKYGRPLHVALRWCLTFKKAFLNAGIRRVLERTVRATAGAERPR